MELALLLQHACLRMLNELHRTRYYDDPWQMFTRVGVTGISTDAAAGSSSPPPFPFSHN